MLQSKIDYQHCAVDINRTIILAGGTAKPASVKDDWSALGDTSLSRTVFLASQLEQLNTSSVIVSGGAGGGVKEATLMAELLVRLHPRDNLDITLDVNAKNTQASARFVRSLDHDESGYYLVTSDWHMARAQAIFDNHGIKVCPVTSKESYVPYGFPGWFIPQKSALVKFELAWHEFGGLLFLWWSSL